MQHAYLALARFTLRRLAAGKRFWSAAVILSLPPLIALVLCLATKDPRASIFHWMMIELETYLAALLVSLIYAIAMTSSEIEDGTAAYVLLAALPKWAVACVQVVMTAAGLAAMSAASIAATWLVCVLSGGTEPPAAKLIARYVIVDGVALLAYLSVFVVIGYAFKRGIAISVAVGVVWEAMLVRMPIRFAAFTITNNVRALIVSLGLEGERGWYFRYVMGYDFPTYGSASMFLSILVATALTLGMVAAMNRNLVRGSE